MLKQSYNEIDRLKGKFVAANEEIGNKRSKIDDLLATNKRLEAQIRQYQLVNESLKNKCSDQMIQIKYLSQNHVIENRLDTLEATKHEDLSRGKNKEDALFQMDQLKGEISFEPSNEEDDCYIRASDFKQEARMLFQKERDGKDSSKDQPVACAPEITYVSSFEWKSMAQQDQTTQNDHAGVPHSKQHTKDYFATGIDRKDNNKNQLMHGETSCQIKAKTTENVGTRENKASCSHIKPLKLYSLPRSFTQRDYEKDISKEELNDIHHEPKWQDLTSMRGKQTFGNLLRNYSSEKKIMYHKE